MPPSNTFQWILHQILHQILFNENLSSFLFLPFPGRNNSYIKDHLHYHIYDWQLSLLIQFISYNHQNVTRNTLIWSRCLCLQPVMLPRCLQDWAHIPYRVFNDSDDQMSNYLLRLDLQYPLSAISSMAIDSPPANYLLTHLFWIGNTWILSLGTDFTSYSFSYYSWVSIYI